MPIAYGATGYRPDRDWDRDGDVDLDDYDIVLNHMSDDAGPNTTRFRTGNIIGYAGYIFEEELGLYLVRNRCSGGCVGGRR